MSIEKMFRHWNEKSNDDFDDDDDDLLLDHRMICLFVFHSFSIVFSFFILYRNGYYPMKRNE